MLNTGMFIYWLSIHYLTHILCTSATVQNAKLYILRYVDLQGGPKNCKRFSGQTERKRTTRDVVMCKFNRSASPWQRVVTSRTIIMRTHHQAVSNFTMKIAFNEQWHEHWFSLEMYAFKRLWESSSVIQVGLFTQLWAYSSLQCIQRHYSRRPIFWCLI